MNNPYYPMPPQAPWPDPAAIAGGQAAAPTPLGAPPMMAPYPAYPVNNPAYTAAPAPAWVQAPAAVAPATPLLNARFVKGALIGGLAAYLLTNDNVQQAAIKSSVKVWAMLQGGIEEMKERFRDAEAELHAADPADDDGD
jgi:hypothetical protein